MARKEKNGIMKGAAQIAVGGFLAKLIGAVYRIPLTNLLGGEGIGLYQLVYPFYCLLLTLSATGIPSALAKLVAEKRARGETPAKLFGTAMRLFLGIGGVATLLMIALSPVLAKAQGERGLTYGYLALAPSVLLVSAISVFRGFFQGTGDMFPTACSEVLEQLIKVAVGLVVAWIFRENLFRAVTALLFAVTLSELFTLLFLALRFKKKKAAVCVGKRGTPVSKRQVLALSVPVALASLLLPLSGVVESIVLVRLLRGYAENAVALYGLFSGGAVTIVNLPVSVCYGVAVASVPALSKAAVEGVGVRKRILYSLGLTLALSSVAAVGLYFCSGFVVPLIFRSLTQEQTEVLIRLVKLFSLSAVTLSSTQTLSASLTALGKPIHSVFSMGFAVVIKTGLGVLLVSKPSVSVYGAAIATDAAYLVSFALEFFFAMRASKNKK